MFQLMWLVCQSLDNLLNMTFYKSLIIIFTALLISCSKSDELILNAYECEKKEFSLLQEDYLNCSGSCKQITLEDKDNKISKNSKISKSWWFKNFQNYLKFQFENLEKLINNTP